MNEYSEVEFKYKADSIKLSDFRELMQTLKPIKQLDVSSWDVYYISDKNPDSFQRLRLSEYPELTKKIKIKEANNWHRVEIDLPLDRNRLTADIVEKFVELDGYKKNFKIYKSCCVYWTEYVNYVYYVVYDENLKELGRFIEAEINKEKIKEIMLTEDVQSVIYKAEDVLTSLGITSQNRMKKSLFELYRK